MAESKTKGFGERLRRAREEAGRDIKSLADVTRVQGRYIQALESEDWSVVPRGVIGRGFVRVIARELGVPPAELLQLYLAARGDADSEPDRSLPESDWKVDLGAGRKSRPLLVGATVVVVAAVAIWLWGHRASTGKGIVAAPPQAPPAATEAATPAATPAAVTPSAVSTKEARAPAASTGDGPAAVAPAASAAPGIALPVAPVTGTLRLDLEAREKVWVMVVEDGGQGRERVLKAGERVKFQAKESFQVKLGNAGAVKLYWNGEALKAAGKSSQVVSLSLPKDLPSMKP